MGCFASHDKPDDLRLSIDPDAAFICTISHVGQQAGATMWPLHQHDGQQALRTAQQLPATCVTWTPWLFESQERSPPPYSQDYPSNQSR